MQEKIKKTSTSKTFLIILSLFAVLAMISVAYIYKANKVNGYVQTETGMLAFFGKITETEACCNGLKITIDSSSKGGGTFMYSSGSMLYMWFNLSSGQCVEGDATSGGVCVKPNTYPPCEEEEDVDGTIRMIGTTLSGPAQGMCQSGSGSSG